MIQFSSNDHNLSDRSIAPKLENEVSESCMERIFQFEDDQLMGTFESFSSAAPGASGPLTESPDFFLRTKFQKWRTFSHPREIYIWMYSVNGHVESATSLLICSIFFNFNLIKFIKFSPFD